MPSWAFPVHVFDSAAEQWCARAGADILDADDDSLSMMDTELWNLDPVFAVSVGTMWREVVAQVQRFVDQNGQSDAPNEMLCGWIDMVESAGRIQGLVLQGGIAAGRTQKESSFGAGVDETAHAGMLGCLIEGERQAGARERARRNAWERRALKKTKKTKKTKKKKTQQPQTPSQQPCPADTEANNGQGSVACGDADELEV